MKYFFIGPIIFLCSCSSNEKKVTEHVPVKSGDVNIAYDLKGSVTLRSFLSMVGLSTKNTGNHKKIFLVKDLEQLPLILADTGKVEKTVIAGPSTIMLMM